MADLQVIERVAERVHEKIVTADEASALKRMTEYTLADAIREGSSVSDQAFTWTAEGDRVCALSAGLSAAKARGYVK